MPAQYQRTLARSTGMALALLLSSGMASAGIISGTVRDTDTRKPIPFVTVRVETTGTSVLANDQGQYRVSLAPGAYHLKFSHVAHYSDYVDVLLADSLVTLDVDLKESIIELPTITVYERAYDPAQRIIVEAIRRKTELLSQLRSYQCQAYVKTVQRRHRTADSSSIEVIAESQLECLWEQPDRYKETITKRRQTANLPANLNLENVEAIPNFNMNRIQYQQYSIISPVAEDALEHYDYYLIDTVFLDGQRVFRLEVEPRNQMEPLVYGTIDIADSSFAVVGVDGGLAGGVYLPLIQDFRYSQRFTLFEGRYWMPNEIHITYAMNLAFPVEVRLSVDYVAALYDYAFDIAIPRGTFDLILEVAKDVDNGDSAEWNARQTIPLTDREELTYKRIDSVAKLPTPVHRRILNWMMWAVAQSNINPDVLHFNRVDGAYAGYRHYWYGPTSRMQMDLKIGYAFSRELWQYHYGVYYKVSSDRQLWVGLLYRNEIGHRPTILNPEGFNPTLWNLFSKADPLDYYRTKGFSVQVDAGLLKQTTLSVAYRDFRHFSESNTTNYSFLERNREYRSNPAIVDGTLRSIWIGFSYDSRPRARIKGKDALKNLPLFTVFAVGAEVASPELIRNDFDFLRYSLYARHTGPIILPGVASLEMCAGGSRRILPPQKYFTVDFTYKLSSEGMFYRTVGSRNFSGNRVAAVYLSNDFGPWFFQKSGLPLVRQIPLSIGIHGGAFWTDFRRHQMQTGDDETDTAPRAYSELGFSIGRILIRPLSYRLSFTWQLSHYDTNRFAFGLGLDL